MGKPGTCEFENFSGLDLRSSREITPPSAALDALNAYLNAGRDYEARPPLVKILDFDSRSRGLYVAGNVLRAALPWESAAALPASRPGLLTYDVVAGGGRTGPMASGVTFDDVVAATTWSSRPYIVIQVTDNGELNYEHHFIPTDPYSVQATVTLTNGSGVVVGLPAPTLGSYWVRFGGVGTGYTAAYQVTAVNTISPVWPGATASGVTANGYDQVLTYVNLPFLPGRAVLTAARKVWAPDFQTNDVWFSSTEFGPTDWTTLNDAGFLPTSQHVDGDQTVQGLGIYRGQLTVLATRAMQLWDIDPDPANMALAGNIGGSGCDFANSVANVGGDIFLFATGQFRSISAVITTGQPKDGDIGTYIASATRTFQPAPAVPVLGIPAEPDIVASWYPELQLYVAIRGTTAYVLTHANTSASAGNQSAQADYTGVNRVSGWTTWALPFGVSHMVAWKGKLYVRRADVPELWAFDKDAVNGYADENAVIQFSGRVRFAWNTLTGDRRMKLIRQAVIPQEGESTMRLFYDPSDDASATEWFDLEGSSTGQGRVMIGTCAEIVSVQFEFSAAWRIGAFSLHYESGNLQ